MIFRRFIMIRSKEDESHEEMIKPERPDWHSSLSAGWRVEESGYRRPRGRYQKLIRDEEETEHMTATYWG
jgi:hypothetical protein